MGDLISRLREMISALGPKMTAAQNETLSEALDALEAAREDAERYRWLRDNNGVRNHHGVEVFIDDEAHAPGHLDAQVDAAREARND